MTYQPSEEILRRYADVMVRCAVHGGGGIKKGETVLVSLPEYALNFYGYLQEAVLQQGANLLLDFTPNGSRKRLLELGSEEQVGFTLPFTTQQKIAEHIDHSISVRGMLNPYEFTGIDTNRIMALNNANRSLWKDHLYNKEREGKFSWTLCWWPTEGCATEAKMSLKEYWEQVIHACYLDESDPVSEWRKTMAEIDRVKEKLNALDIEKVHVVSEDGIDIWISIGEMRQWLGGSGRNIPSYEVYISPDWRGVHGVMVYNEPLYYAGKVITGIRLVFENGIVVESSALQNEDALKTMLSKPNANKMGEFSLTDRRLSRVLRFMANTLFDENKGGRFGNTHAAVGMSYVNSYKGNLLTVSDEQLMALGFNDPHCEVHTDIISTTDRIVTAYCKDGRVLCIYEDGQFMI